MLVLSVNIQVKPGKKEEFIRLAGKCIEGTRKEEGNVSYELFESTEKEDKLMFFEEWVDEAALDAHTKTPHYIEFGEANKDLTINTELKKYITK